MDCDIDNKEIECKDCDLSEKQLSILYQNIMRWLQEIQRNANLNSHMRTKRLKFHFCLRLKLKKN